MTSLCPQRDAGIQVLVISVLRLQREREAGSRVAL